MTVDSPHTSPTNTTENHDARRERARTALLGLALGDALGAQHFVPANLPALRARTLPPAPWPWTDDTEMACAVYAELAAHGRVDQNRLAAAFARHHDFDRGYGPTVNRMLRLIRAGGSWRELAAEPFDGQGSWGNGAAMRVAPLGAWFADDPSRAATEAARSAQVTHTHPEGVAGAIAVAVGAALLAAREPVDPTGFITAVRDHTPPGLVHERLGAAVRLIDRQDPAQVGRILGNGRRVSAPDTVPFTLWIAARYPDAFETACWHTASAGGDVDTTCAIVGGMLGARVGLDALPTTWLNATEPLPAWASETKPEPQPGAVTQV
ncbi:ADP-ribosylglycohydrolase family protein [Yinghuangia seranimata]|uniref:ADP-ribosylglycohydrolase family protein n=1 Tax=Yinghuangia seranimata TaxID=408067 RepID=UPI00248C4918|nr:ADP-ribosylglycohydrolase family protein [Yinghuangia seranimata]MDI2130627.1 ADP-ribosylglycohydrolase family protein [Yinghuangia seranimata]